MSQLIAQRLASSLRKRKVRGSNPTMGKNFLFFNSRFVLLTGAVSPCKYNQPWHTPSLYPFLEKGSLEKKYGRTYISLFISALTFKTTNSIRYLSSTTQCYVTPPPTPSNNGPPLQFYFSFKPLCFKHWQQKFIVLNILSFSKGKSFQKM